METHKEKKKWMKVKKEEMNSLHKNHTYKLVKLPKNRNALRNKWFYKLKGDGITNQVKYRARLVMNGFRLKKYILFDEIFSPFVKKSSIRVIFDLTTSLDLDIEEIEVVTTFLYEI